MSPSTRARADTSSPAMDLIFIEGFRGDTIIGIHHGEFDRPQPLLIDVCAGVPHARACESDQIADTIDYSVVRSRLQRLLAEHRLQLLEALAETIADLLLHEFGAAWVRVTVVKPNKFDDVQALGVQIERCAPAHAPTHAQRAQPGRSAAVLQLLGSGLVPGSGDKP